MVYKVALVGGPGSGKTTLANALTGHFKSNGKNWINIPEYARDFINEEGADALRECGPLIQTVIALEQKKREEVIPRECDGFVTDAPVFLAWFYACNRPWVNDEGRTATRIAREICYKEFVTSIYAYDQIYWVSREKAYVNDGTRTQTEEEAKQIDEFVKVALELHRIPFKTIGGTLNDRISQIQSDYDLATGTVRKTAIVPT